MPSAVFRLRDTREEQRVARRATRGPVRFSLESRDQVIAEAGERHARFHGVCAEGRASVPADRWQALNGIFVGHRSRHWARCRIDGGARAVDHSSSGLVAASGTGPTGRACSIGEAARLCLEADIAEAACGSWVREPFPGVATSTDPGADQSAIAPLTVFSRVTEEGVRFADGIARDFVRCDWRRRVAITPAAQTLNRVTVSGRCPPGVSRSAHPRAEMAATCGMAFEYCSV